MTTTRRNLLVAVLGGRQVFDTVEVNTTFHALPTESTVRNWYRKTPGDCTFA
jgi:uncharacterized protein YecE (DUF72 family)